MSFRFHYWTTSNPDRHYAVCVVCRMRSNWPGAVRGCKGTESIKKMREAAEKALEEKKISDAQARAAEEITNSRACRVEHLLEMLACVESVVQAEHSYTLKVPGGGNLGHGGHRKGGGK